MTYGVNVPSQKLESFLKRITENYFFTSSKEEQYPEAFKTIHLEFYSAQDKKNALRVLNNI